MTDEAESLWVFRSDRDLQKENIALIMMLMIAKGELLEMQKLNRAFTFGRPDAPFFCSS